MLCGVLELRIVDAERGSLRHAHNKFWQAAIGKEVEIDGVKYMRFTIEFLKLYEPYTFLKFERGETLMGYLYIKCPEDIIKLEPQIITLLMPSSDKINEAFEEKKNLIGKATSEFIENVNDRVFDVEYQIEHTKCQHYVRKIVFDVPLDMIKEIQKVIFHLSNGTIREI